MDLDKIRKKSSFPKNLHLRPRPNFSPMRYLIALAVLWTSCSDRPPTTPEPRPVDNPNAGNTAIYDVDPDDPYEIGDGSFLDMRPGQPLDRFSDLLTAGSLEDGEGTPDVHYIRGRKDQELGYVLPEPDDATLIGTIVITSPDVVTENGIRVGNSYAELVERRGELEVHGTADERVYVSDGPLDYRLNMANKQYDLDTARIDPTTVISQIEIRR